MKKRGCAFRNTKQSGTAAENSGLSELINTESGMAMAITDFSAFLAEEIIKVKGIAYPVKAGFLRRVFIRRAACSKLHPNPNDEFCSPEIGPNYEIMSRYMSEYRRVISGSLDPLFINTAAKRSYEADWYGSDGKDREGSSLGERILVERIHPNEYMILNAHHRWRSLPHRAGHAPDPDR